MMKRRVIATIITAGIVLMLSGCGESAIKCDDNDAQKTVMSIAKDEMKNQLARMNTIYTYQGLQEAAKTTPELSKYIDKIDNDYLTSQPTLINIRTEAMDDNLQKSECAAEISFANGNKIPIKYKLSKTSEGKLFAEVFGL